MESPAIRPSASRILIIEDDLVFREALRKLLSRAGYEVTVVTDAQEGIKQVLASFFDVILLDLTMPDLSGEEVLQVIRPLGLRSKIVAISARSDDGWKSRVRDLGAVTAFEKPVRFDDLLSFLVRLTGVPPQDGGKSALGSPAGRRNPFWDRLLPLVFGYPDGSATQKALALGILLGMGALVAWLFAGKRI
jgi:CheY-like chemotaxis protein